MPTRHRSRIMGDNQAEILEKLMHMKKELARKERKLKKCVRATSAKEHVKRRLREQEMLDGKASAVHLTSELCPTPQASSDTYRSVQSNRFDKLSETLQQKILSQRHSNKTSPVVSISPNHRSITPSLDLSTEPGQVFNTSVDFHGPSGASTTSQCKGGTTAVKSVRCSLHAIDQGKNSQLTVHGDRNVKSDRSTCSQPDQHKSEDNGEKILQNNKTKDVVSANNCLYTNSKAEIIILSESESEKSLSWNSSGNSVSSGNEHQGKRSLSLKRKRNLSSTGHVPPPKGDKCKKETIETNLAKSNHAVGTSACNQGTPVDIGEHSVVVRCEKTEKNREKISNIADSSLSKDEEKIPDVIFIQIEPTSLSKQEHPKARLKKPEKPEVKQKKPEYPVGKPKKPNFGSDTNIQEKSGENKVKRKCVKRRRRTIGRILDVELEKEIKFPVNSSESSQNSEEYETLLLIQQSYRSGVDYSTRHGQTHNLPSMLSSIFQYFIDENRRQNNLTDFSLPEDQFGRMMRKRIKEISGEVSNHFQHEKGIPGFEHHMDKSSLSSIETSQELFHPHRQGVKSSASFTYDPKIVKRKNGRTRKTESVKKSSPSCQHRQEIPEISQLSHNAGVDESEIIQGEITPITDSSSHVSVKCPQISTRNYTQQKHNKDSQKTSSDCLSEKESSEKQNSLTYDQHFELSSNCFESQETPKCYTESHVYSEEFIPMSPALFASPTDDPDTDDSASVTDSQDSPLLHSRRSNKGEKLKHLSCIKLTHNDSLRCVAACCIQIIRRRTDVVLCIGQSTISLWNQTGDTYTCVDTWKLEQNSSSVECYTYPAIFREKFCYFVIVLRDVKCTVQVVHFNAKTERSQLIQCLQGNSVTACCLSVEALAVGHTNQALTRVTKYSLNCDGQLSVQQEFDPCPCGLTTPRCLILVENLPSALVLWSSNNTLVVWNTDTGTLVWTLDLSLTWAEMSTLVSAEWQQEYLLLSLFTEKKSDDAGVLLVVNPETEISKVLIHYNATGWEGLKCVGQLEDSIVATDYNGQTCVWEAYSGQPSYQCDLSTGVKGLGHYWRKVITMYNHCVHIFK